MNKKTITKHILKIDADIIQKNLLAHFADIVNNYINQDIKDLEIQVEAFHKVVIYLKNYDWNSIFSEGYTVMALPDEDMEFVEDFFQCKKNGGAYKNDELELHIIKNGQFVSRIDENSIDF